MNWVDCATRFVELIEKVRPENGNSLGGTCVYKGSPHPLCQSLTPHCLHPFLGLEVQTILDNINNNHART